MKLPISSVVSEMKDRPYTMLTIIALSVAVTWGWLNVAWASDIDKLQSQVTEQGKATDKILALSVANSLRAIKEQLCTMSQSSNSDKQALQQLLEAQQLEYYQLTGTRYPLGNCN